jgi:hypothetical protein
MREKCYALHMQAQKSVRFDHRICWPLVQGKSLALLCWLLYRLGPHLSSSLCSSPFTDATYCVHYIETIEGTNSKL